MEGCGLRVTTKNSRKQRIKLWENYFNQSKKIKRRKMPRGNSLAVQWLELHAFTAEGPGSIPGWGTKIPQAAQHSQKKRKKMHRKMDREKK